MMASIIPPHVPKTPPDIYKNDRRQGTIAGIITWFIICLIVFPIIGNAIIGLHTTNDWLVWFIFGTGAAILSTLQFSYGDW